MRTSRRWPRSVFFADQTYHFQTLRVLNDIAADEADTSEVLQTIERIRSGDTQGRFQAWSQRGDRVVRRAGAAIDRLSKGRALLRAHNYYHGGILAPVGGSQASRGGLGSSLWTATSGCVLRISTKLRDVVRRLLVRATVNNEILRFLRILFNIVLLIKFLPTGSFMTEPRVRPRGAAALPTLVRKAPPQSMTGSRAGRRVL